MKAGRGVGFGTSGLRGPAQGFDAATVGAHVGAFIAVCCQGAAERRVMIGRDRRASSPAIAGLVAAAVRAAGWEPVNCGQVPTPALAFYALGRGAPAIMVTGSHIPADQNGLKFYRPDGELRKQDEAPLAEAARRRMQDPPPAAAALPPAAVLPPEDGAARMAYRARFLAGFAPDALSGLRLGVYMHSAVGGEELAGIVAGLGAEVRAFGGSDAFVAVDTEAVDAEAMELMGAEVAAHGLDAVISTDGDGDRPLLIDATGRQINGDVLGALAARALGARTVVTPLTSTSAIEACGWFETVVRTRIGSPFVVEEMAAAPGAAIVGFEANGGFLVQTPLHWQGRRLDPLPTRDAVLPLVMVLAEAGKLGLSVDALAAQLPSRAMRADRLKRVAADIGTGLVVGLARSASMRAALDPALAEPGDIDTRDGTRMTRADGVIVHVRQSGNADELRCYVEADTPEAAERHLAGAMARLGALVAKASAAK